MSKYDRFQKFPRRATVTDTLTRPADTTQYAAGDMIADSASAPTVNVLAGAALANGRSGTIRAVTLIDSANLAAPADLEIWFFDSAYTLANDNAAAAFTDAVAKKAQAIVSLPGAASFVGHAGADAAGNRVYQKTGIDKDFKCAAASKDLWWALVVRNAYTPVSAEEFTLHVDVEQN
jgi:hypothetical protein